jgi:hypothetical protein
VIEEGERIGELLDHVASSELAPLRHLRNRDDAGIECGSELAEQGEHALGLRVGPGPLLGDDHLVGVERDEARRQVHGGAHHRLEIARLQDMNPPRRR